MWPMTRFIFNNPFKLAVILIVLVGYLMGGFVGAIACAAACLVVAGIFRALGESND